jgi:hypothetical protein
MEKTVSVKTESETVKVAVITSQNKIVTAQTPDENNNLQLKTSGELSSFTQSSTRKPTNRFNAHVEHIPSQETDKAISFINSQNLGWKADTCKL